MLGQCSVVRFLSVFKNHSEKCFSHRLQRIIQHVNRLNILLTFLTGKEILFMEKSFYITSGWIKYAISKSTYRKNNTYFLLCVFLYHIFINSLLGFFWLLSSSTTELIHWSFYQTFLAMHIKKYSIVLFYKEGSLASGLQSLSPTAYSGFIKIAKTFSLHLIQKVDVFSWQGRLNSLTMIKIR